MTVACPGCKRNVPGGIPLCQYCGTRLQPPISCAACGHTITAGLSKCPYCNASTEQAAPATAVAVAPPDPVAALQPLKPIDLTDMHKFRVEVAARVMWGEERQAIRADLLKSGVPARVADLALTQAFKDREAHFRKAGARDIGTAIACCAGLVVVVLLFVLMRKGVRSIHIMGTLFLLMGALPIGAIFYFTRGSRRIATGGKDEREASDVDEDL